MNMVSRETFFRKLSILILSCVLLLPGLFSCGRVEYTDEELLAAAKELIPQSLELNEIYFGEGLPISDDRETVERFYAAFNKAVDSDVKSLNYHPVAKDCGYESIDDIKSATALVFSPDYCNYLYELAFSGISAFCVFFSFFAVCRIRHKRIRRACDIRYSRRYRQKHRNKADEQSHHSSERSVNLLHNMSLFLSPVLKPKIYIIHVILLP